MKFMRCLLDFELPEDFEGDFNDILTEIIRYRKEQYPDGNLKLSSLGEKDIPKSCYEALEFVYNQLLKDREEGCRHVGMVDVQTWNGKIWQRDESLFVGGG